MRTDYQRHFAAVRARRRRESEWSDTTSAIDVYTASFSRRRHDPLKDILFELHPDVERRPSQYEAGDARRVIGRCEEHASRPAVFFILRVTRREARFPLRLQGGPSVARFGRGDRGQRRPRLEYRAVQRSYQVIEWDTRADELRVKGVFTNKVDAADALRIALDGAS